MAALTPCPRCRRLHRREARCPFCTFGSALALALPLVAACHADRVAPDAAPGAAPSSNAAPAAVGSPIAEASSSSVAPSSPPRDAGRVDASGGLIGISGGFDGGIAAISAYGAAPIDEVRGPRGEIALTLSQSGTADAVAFQRRAAVLRACYQRGLYLDPGEHGELAITLTIDTAGAATAAERSATGLSPAVKQCMLTQASKAIFAAGAARKLDVTVKATIAP